MPTGTVKFFNSRKGYGFITADEDETDVFVHYSNIVASENEFRTLNKGDEVSYDVEPGRKGPEARNVNVTKKAPPQPRPQRNNRFSSYNRRY